MQLSPLVVIRRLRLGYLVPRTTRKVALFSSSSGGLPDGTSFGDSIMALAKFTVPLVAVCTVIAIWGPQTTVGEFFGIEKIDNLEFKESFLRERGEKAFGHSVAANASVPRRNASGRV